MKNISFLFGIFFALQSLAFSTVSIQVAVEWDPGVTVGTIGVLVVDKNADGFSGIATPSVDLLGTPLEANGLFGADDLILGTLDVVDTSGNGVRGLQGNIAGITLGDGVDAGDPLGVYWFDAPASSPVAAGQSFGFYRTDTLDPASLGTIVFTMPSDNAGDDLNAFSQSITGEGTSALDPAFMANNGTVIPEPSGAALIALSGLLFVRRRRR